jgi:2-polyprenyl-6-methoxyphenol hydroxylase-like FAD-dependent oxidoreductase
LRNTVATQNDGTHTAEPGQRCSQIVLEGWLKKKIHEQPLIDGKWGYKYISHVEGEDGVEATFVNLENENLTLKGSYLVGCDGGASRVRKCTGIKMDGGPMYVYQIPLLQWYR